MEKVRSSGMNPLRKVMIIGRTRYISIPLESVQTYGIERGMVYEFAYENGKLVFKPVEEK